MEHRHVNMGLVRGKDTHRAFLTRRAPHAHNHTDSNGILIGSVFWNSYLPVCIMSHYLRVNHVPCTSQLQ
eukprot:3177352-Prymnesium_polylepis.1